MKYVDKNKNLKKLQKIELEMLKYFDEICHKHNLEYFLAYGTLIGAVRHQGFIPWDDDIDIYMKGQDYIKLVDILKDNKNKKYFFQSLETEKNYYLLWNKIRINNTVLIEKGWENIKVHKGISLDIFPLFDYPEDNSTYKKIARKYKISRLLIENNISPNGFYKSYGKFGKILSKILKLVPHSIRNKIVQKNVNYFANYSLNSSSYFSTDRGLIRKMNKNDFDKSILLKFEDKRFSCPSGYDHLLKGIYGNYMELPKEEDRVGHGEVYLCFNTKDDTNEQKK